MCFVLLFWIKYVLLNLSVGFVVHLFSLTEYETSLSCFYAIIIFYTRGQYQPIEKLQFSLASAFQ